jgi:hypothetical protein
VFGVQINIKQGFQAVCFGYSVSICIVKDFRVVFVNVWEWENVKLMYA